TLNLLTVHVLRDDDDEDNVHFSKLANVPFPKLPKSILTCRTLVSLDLRGFGVKEFTFPSIGFGFPSLNVLKLNDIVFHEVRDFMLLLAGCPILEDLLAIDIYFHRKEDPLTIQEFKSLSLPKLISAVITECWCSCFPVKALSNLEYLSVDTSMLCEKDHKVHDVRFIWNIMH
ncbi:F-box/RNI/FBD-like domain protein, partial [Trifolium medium]|nr:F-box/RNI/FBD-like domain protein [Trifolium medium]